MTDNSSFKSIVLQVKRAYDIVDYIKQSGVSLKRSGNGKWKGLCPFHNEKTPSFVVDENFQNYRCFGCGAHGDLVSYVEATESLDFMEALRSLAEDKGIEISLSDHESSTDWRSLKAILKDTANFFYREFRKLPEDHEAVRQITDRGLPTTGSIMYGYAPAGNALYKFLSSKHYSDELIIQAGVCKKSEKTSRMFDFWQSRLMFFVTDITGKPIGFSGRKLFDTDTMGKYVNSPDTPLFDKSSSLFNVQNAKKSASEDKTIYVTEGQFDVASLVSAGLRNTVASLGTAFTEQQGLICRRLVSEDGRIVFCFDGDDAGINAAAKVFKNIPAIHSQAYVVILPDGLDPCDFRMKHGDEELLSYVRDNQKSMIEFMLDTVAGQNDLTSPMGTSRYVSQAASILKTIASNTLREAFIRKVALSGFTSVDDVREAVTQAKPISPQSFAKDSESHEGTPEESRPYEEGDETLDQDEIIGRIDTDPVYGAVARMFLLTLLRESWRKRFISSADLYPDEMRWMADDMKSLGEHSRILPEDFRYARVMDHIMMSNLVPLQNTMTTDDIRDQIIYLHGFLEKKRATAEVESVRAQVARFLEQSGDVESVDFLKKALEMEANLLQRR